MNEQEAKPRQFSRRDFIRYIALPVATVPLVAGCGLSQTKEVDTVKEVKTEEVENTLETMGLGDYSLIYSTSKRLIDTFEATIFTEIYDTCKQVIEGKITDKNHPDIVQLRDGWGEKEKDADIDALKRINQFDIDIKDTGTNQDSVRQFLNKASKGFW